MQNAWAFLCLEDGYRDPQGKSFTRPIQYCRIIWSFLMQERYIDPPIGGSRGMWILLVKWEHANKYIYKQHHMWWPFLYDYSEQWAHFQNDVDVFKIFLEVRIIGGPFFSSFDFCYHLLSLLPTKLPFRSCVIRLVCGCCMIKTNFVGILTFSILYLLVTTNLALIYSAISLLLMQAP